MPDQHHCNFQHRDDSGKWSGGFMKEYNCGGAVKHDRKHYADGGAVNGKQRKEESSGLAAIPRHLGAAAGMADYALGGLPSTAVGLVHGLMPGGPGYSDVKASSEAALDDFRELYPNVAAPMLEMLDDPVGAGLFGLPAFLRRASRASKVSDSAEKLSAARARLDEINGEIARMGEEPVKVIRRPGGWPSPEDELRAAETRIGLANDALRQARESGMQRTRDMAEGRIPKALPPPRPGDIPVPSGNAADWPQAYDFVPQKIRAMRGDRPASRVRAENDPDLAPMMALRRQRQERDAFRRNLAVRDELAGGPAQRALMRQDENVDEFVSNLLGQYRRETIPDLPDDKVAPRMRGVERFIVNEALDPMSKGALGDEIPIPEAVRSMMRRGYALPGVNMSVLQDRSKGRFMANTPAEREFKASVKSGAADPAIQRALKRIWRSGDDQ